MTDAKHANGSGLGTEPKNGGTVVKNTFDGAWLAYQRADFGTAGMNRVELVYGAPSGRAPEDARAEIRLGSVDGTLIATVALPQTGTSWDTYRTATADLNTTVTGLQDVYIVLRGTTNGSQPYIGNFDLFTFDKI